MVCNGKAAPAKIAIVGLGYVGCVTAACFAELGHEVVGVDRDEHKVGKVMAGEAPFFEPGLEELVAKNRAAGRLSATSSIQEALAGAEAAFLCVGTPSEQNGNMALDQLRRVCMEIAACPPEVKADLIVVVRSTVFPGTCEKVVEQLLGPGQAVVANPEFLREGEAVRDFMEPALLVVGGKDARAVGRVAALYEPLKVEACRVSLGTAETIKYACNAFHAVKIGFANEIGALCERLDVPAGEVMETFCRDAKLNLSGAYLKPGFAFGGSCLPKDLRALNYRSARLDLRLPLLDSVLAANEEHLKRAMRAVMELPARRLGVYGLAFKENTDDLRESPVVLLLEYLIGKGKDLRVFDPQVRLDQVYGSNRNFLLSSVPHIGRLIEPELAGLLGWADYLVIAQKPAAWAAEAIVRSGLPFLDVARTIPPAVRAAQQQEY